MALIYVLFGVSYYLLMILSYMQRVSSTQELALLHTNFEQTLLSAGGEISPRWRLSRQLEDHLPQPVVEVDENIPETLGQGDKGTTTKEESENIKSSIPSEVATAGPLENDPSQQLMSASCSGEEASFSSSPPPPFKPILHDDLCYNAPSEVSKWTEAIDNIINIKSI